MAEGYKYSSAKNSHYSCPSMYGKIVRQEYTMQPKYCSSKSSMGDMSGGMKGAKSNKQSGA